MADTDREWQVWSEVDPYYGVLSDDRFRSQTLEDHRDAFFELGRLSIEERLATAERTFGSLRRGRALDFGCGVGRLSLPLAAAFEEVLGLDVAPQMLAEAERNAAMHGIGNLRLARSDDGLIAAEGQFDFIVSLLVFQHIPVKRGLRILSRLLDCVAPGGVAALHLCIDRGDTPAARMRYWAQRHVPTVNGIFNRMQGRLWSEPLMQMNAYPLGHVLDLAKQAGFGPCLVKPAAHGRFMTVQLLMQRH